MSDKSLNLITRRSFLDLSVKSGLGVALSTLVDIPPFVRRALAEGNIGLHGKKVLFIFLRGANDALNSVIPVQDRAYYNMGTVASPDLTRPDIGIAKDTAAGANYDVSGRPCFDATLARDAAGTARLSTDPVYSYDKAISLGNGFAALHPSLKFLAPVYNDGQLALIHRVGYPKQSRSHFDSQNFWENGAPFSNTVRDGVFYRAMVESGLAQTSPLTGVSVQRSLPMILRGSGAAMTNLTDTDRYSLLGVPGLSGAGKSAEFLKELNRLPYTPKREREMLHLQHENLSQTLSIFEDLRPSFNEAGNTFRDDVITDGDRDWYEANGNQGYYLFPTRDEINGGWVRPGAGAPKDAQKYVVPPGTTSDEFFTNLKAAALILNKTDAIVAGTQLDGFDTHSNQGGATGSHANLQRRIGWAIYALRKYFTRYADRAQWKNVVVVTLTEFGRTTVQNSDEGTDHAEAGLMWVAGGSVRGYGQGRSGVFGCHPNDVVKWIPGPPNQTGIGDGSMFGVDDRYLKRAYDYRSVLGKIIRDHLGSTQAQLERIIPGYTDKREALALGGTSQLDGTPIMGEPAIL
jgi:uncharacterized protein (DUF1501 family)